MVDSDIELTEYTALQIKQAVVGKGNAGKEQVQEMVKRLLRLPALPGVAEALDSLARLASAADSPAVSLSFDLAELGGFNYLLAYMMFGDMKLKDALSSINLFHTAVMPEVDRM